MFKGLLAGFQTQITFVSLLLSGFGMSWLIGYSDVFVENLLHKAGATDTEVGYAASVYSVGEFISSLGFLYLIKFLSPEKNYTLAIVGTVASVVVLCVFKVSLVMIYVPYIMQGIFFTILFHNSQTPLSAWLCLRFSCLW